MSDFDCQGMADMSTKELYVLNFWRRALIECYKNKGAVSAGTLGKWVGQSRTTAKKYLDRLVVEKCVGYEETVWINGVMSKVYFPLKGPVQS